MSDEETKEPNQEEKNKDQEKISDEELKRRKKEKREKDRKIREEIAESISRVTTDMNEAAKLMTHQEVRYLVDLYYQVQDFRIQAASQVRSMTQSKEPISLLGWVYKCMETVEDEIRNMLDIYSDHESTGMGKWAKAHWGIGPVMSSALLAHINLEPWKCVHVDAKGKNRCKPEDPHGPECHYTILHTAGHIWRFAGQDPTCKWEKGTKRPWNAKLKVLCWKLGESFVKVSNKEDELYGHLYAQRKLEYQKKNDEGGFKATAEAALEAKNYGKDTDAYKAYSKGILPPAHIHAMARRYAVKIFLSHWHAEAYRRKYGKEPPKPFAIAILGHAHEIDPIE